MLTQSDIVAAARRLQQLERQEVFDPRRPGSRPTPFQQTIIDDFGKVLTQHAVAGNRSGKSQMGARIMAWMLAEDKPGWKRPPEWGPGTLQFLMIGRISKHVEEVMYRKIRAFFDEGELHETRIGNALQKVTHRKTGNSILCASHNNVKEAREKVQAYELQGIWLDEMPGDAVILDEIDVRLQDRKGFLFTSFTPLVRNLEIKRKVEACRLPAGKHYKMRMFDNPIYSEEDKAGILKKMEGMPEAYIRCRLDGDWMEGDFSVYAVPDAAFGNCDGYHTGWNHVESADPALQSKFGQVVFAQDPRTQFWWIVRDDYISGIYVPTELVATVRERLKGLTITRRVCDPASTWYIGQAAAEGIHYMTPWDKNNRRPEMMKNWQAALGTTVFFAPWCTNLPHELGAMQWSETADDKVINQHAYHLHDAAIYGFDCLPKQKQATPPLEFHVRLRIQEEKDRKAAAAPKSPEGKNPFYRKYKINARRRRGYL